MMEACTDTVSESNRNEETASINGEAPRHFQILPTRGGLPSVKLLSHEQEVWLHSPYDPVREARQWVAELTLEEGQVALVFGFGMGYHVAALAQNFPKNTILVFEPVSELFELARQNINLEELLVAPNVHVFTGLQGSRLIDFLAQHVQLHAREKIKLFEYPPLVRVFKEQYDQLGRSLVDGLNTLLISSNTIRFFSGKWTENFFLNLPYIIDSPGVEQLFGTFAGRPGVIVSAGPSLSKNIDLLKQVKGKGLIIVVGTALRPVLQAGIEPDLVVTADGGKPNYLHFEGIRLEMVDLVYHPLVYPRIVSEHGGPRWTMDGDFLFNGWLQKITGTSKGDVLMGPSVANVAFDLAFKLGLNTIVLIGQDLAFTDGLSHAKGTLQQDERPLEEKDRELFEVEDVFGGKVWTDRVLNTMRDWFNRRIADLPVGVTVVDATEGGARIEGTRVMSFHAAIEQYFCEEFDVRQIILNARAKFQPLSGEKKQEIIEQLLQTQKDLRMISRLCDKAIKYGTGLEKLYESKRQSEAEIDSYLKKMNRIDRRLKKYEQNFALLNLIFQPAAYSLAQSFAAGPEESEPERGRRLASKSKFLYMGISSAAKHLQDILEQAVKNMEQLLGEESGNPDGKPVFALPAAKHTNSVSG